MRNLDCESEILGQQVGSFLADEPVDIHISKEAASVDEWTYKAEEYVFVPKLSYGPQWSKGLPMKREWGKTYGANTQIDTFEVFGT